jgi:hypothetical protein
MRIVHSLFSQQSKFILRLALSGALMLNSLSGWAGDQLAGRLNNNANVYREANPVSEILGQFPKGKTFWLTSGETDGFYSIAFPKPFKGATVGWIQASDLQVYAPGGSGPKGRTGARSAGGVRDSSVSFSVGIAPASPADWQSKIGEASGSISPMMVSLEYRRGMGGKLFLGGEFTYLKFSQATATVAKGSYTASGFGFGVPVGMYFVAEPNFSVAGILFAGVSSMTAGNTTATQEISTANIIAMRFGAKVEGAYWVNRNFGFMGQAGYQMSTLSSVATLSSTGTQVNSDINLSGIFFGAGIRYAF